MIRTPQTAASFGAQLAILHEHDCWDRLAGISVPSLVLVAESDIFIRPTLSRRLLERLPDARWTSVAGGLAMMRENPAAWTGAILDFIRAIAGRP